MNLFQESFPQRLLPSWHGVGPAAGSRMLLAVLDEIACGVLVCDQDGHVCFANHTARTELRTGRLLALEDSRLRRACGADGDIDSAIRLAASRGRRSLVRLCLNDERLVVSVLPTDHADDSQRSVLLIMGRRLACSELGLEMLASSYGLTLAERRVLDALIHEATPNEIARNHEVALSTIRTQIASIRAKVGARSIDSLLLRVFEVPPIAHALRSAEFAPRVGASQVAWRAAA